MQVKRKLELSAKDSKSNNLNDISLEDNSEKQKEELIKPKNLTFNNAAKLLKYLRGTFKLSSASSDVTEARATIYVQVLAQMLVDKYFAPDTKIKTTVKFNIPDLVSESGVDRRVGGKRVRFCMLALILDHPNPKFSTHTFIIIHKFLQENKCGNIVLKNKNGDNIHLYQSILKYCIAIKWYPEQISTLLNSAITKEELIDDLPSLLKLAGEITETKRYDYNTITSEVELPYESELFKSMNNIPKTQHRSNPIKIYESTYSSKRKRKYTEFKAAVLKYEPDELDQSNLLITPVPVLGIQSPFESTITTSTIDTHRHEALSPNNTGSTCEANRDSELIYDSTTQTLDRQQTKATNDQIINLDDLPKERPTKLLKPNPLNETIIVSDKFPISVSSLDDSNDDREFFAPFLAPIPDSLDKEDTYFYENSYEAEFSMDGDQASYLNLLLSKEQQNTTNAFLSQTMLPYGERKANVRYCYDCRAYCYISCGHEHSLSK